MEVCVWAVTIEAKAGAVKSPGTDVQGMPKIHTWQRAGTSWTKINTMAVKLSFEEVSSTTNRNKCPFMLVTVQDIIQNHF